MIPTFLLMKYLGLIDTLGSLIVPSLVTPFAVFLFRQFFLSLPQEIEEAAWIDGCSRVRTLWLIVLPLARPVVGTVAVLTFLSTWNDLAWPLIAINNDHNYTLQLGLTTFQGQHRTAVGGGHGREPHHRAPGARRVPRRTAHVHPVAHLVGGQGLIARAG